MKLLHTLVNQAPSLFYFILIALFSTGLIGCNLDLSQFDLDRDETNPMIFNIDDLTQADACDVHDPMFPNGNLYATIYNEDRTVALMIMEENGGINGGQGWKEGQWDTYPYEKPFFQVQLLMGRNLGQTPCSTLDQPEEIDQVFLPAQTYPMSQETNTSSSPFFSYYVDAPGCVQCSVEFTAHAESFWLVSSQNDFAIIDRFSHYTNVAFTR
jgi:hypothetical protein